MGSAVVKEAVGAKAENEKGKFGAEEDFNTEDTEDGEKTEKCGEKIFGEANPGSLI
jgi:hypothetical protein